MLYLALIIFVVVFLGGLLLAYRHFTHDTVPITIVTGQKKVVDVDKYYSVERLRPKYESFLRQPLFIMTSDV